MAALGALVLVDQGKLTLDGAVNATLTSWKIPGNEFTRNQKVSLRHLLSHAGGTTVHGFPGYPADGGIPTLLQVLDGKGNTRPIRVDMAPGKKFRYSGGGYCIVQQLIIDVTGMAFPKVMQELVLDPLGMEHSTFEQPLSEAMRAQAAAAHVKGKRLPGRWHATQRWPQPGSGPPPPIWLASLSEPGKPGRANQMQ